MDVSPSPDTADTDLNKRDDSITAAPRDKASNARRGSDGGNAGKRPRADLAGQDIKRRKVPCCAQMLLCALQSIHSNTRFTSLHVWE